VNKLKRKEGLSRPVNVGINGVRPSKTVFRSRAKGRGVGFGFLLLKKRSPRAKIVSWVRGLSRMEEEKGLCEGRPDRRGVLGEPQTGGRQARGKMKMSQKDHMRKRSVPPAGNFTCQRGQRKSFSHQAPGMGTRWSKSLDQTEMAGVHPV